jgi:hypothetical protein
MRLRFKDEMSTAVYRRLPVAAWRMNVFERTKIYRDAAGAAPRPLEATIASKPLHMALNHAVQDVTFLESETSTLQPVDLTLNNKTRDTDPYLLPYIRDLMDIYFPKKHAGSQ